MQAATPTQSPCLDEPNGSTAITTPAKPARMARILAGLQPLVQEQRRQKCNNHGRHEDKDVEEAQRQVAQGDDNTEIVAQVEAGAQQLPLWPLGPQRLQIVTPQAANDEQSHDGQAEERKNLVSRQLRAAHHFDACIGEDPAGESSQGKTDSLEIGRSRFHHTQYDLRCRLAVSLRPTSRYTGCARLVGAIVGDEDGAVFGGGYADGSAPGVAIWQDESGEEVFVAAVGVSGVMEGHANDLVAGAGGAVPGAVLGGEDVSSILLRNWLPS